MRVCASFILFVMPYLVDIPERTDYCFNFFICLFVCKREMGELDLGEGWRVKKGGKYGQHIMYERKIKKKHSDLKRTKEI